MNILTFDIEDWWVYKRYQIGAEKDYIPRLERYLNNILDLLDECNYKATFFCLSIMAEKYPEIIRLIDSRGHQIGCHSYSHDFFLNKGVQYFKEDTKKAIEILESIISKKIIAYRAPAFSITENNKWAFEILIENGLEFDCSVFPTTRSFGGFPSYNTDIPAIIEINGMYIKEFPISLTEILGRKVAYSGGGYFRLFPYCWVRSIMQKSNYVMTYFHLKDFDKDQKRKILTLGEEHILVRYLKNYYGLSSCYENFIKLVNDFHFLSLEEADKLINWENTECIRL